jgi:hypothetical protein
MSIGTILLIILVIALLGGFSGIGGSPFYRTGLLWGRRPRSCNCCSVDPGFAWTGFDAAKAINPAMTRIRRRSWNSALDVFWGDASVECASALIAFPEKPKRPNMRARYCFVPGNVRLWFAAQ